jgi:hypothetical protein
MAGIAELVKLEKIVFNEGKNLTFNRLTVPLLFSMNRQSIKRSI